MLFNSYTFILLFLPTTLAGYYLLIRSAGMRWAVLWLTVASLIFYGYWDPRYVGLILLSVAVNGLLGRQLAKVRTRGGPYARLLLAAGVIFNLGLLGYFKYVNFFFDNLNVVFALNINIADIVLPIGISFFTFQQIAFLVDIYRRELNDFSGFSYSLFITFFPQLIAGPIVHHKEMMPQFASAPRGVLAEHLPVGLTIFAIGLAKKVLIADSFAVGATPVFTAASAGYSPTLIEAWSAVLCYAFQIYFDFSAYSDMAVGLGRMFGIRLPINFASPYKATSIIDFWRRWHITLSRFLRDYLYVPLGGNRCGRARRHINVLLTMILGGIWHGAGWTFLLWGTLHGAYIVINQLWRETRGPSRRRLPAPVAMASTFLLVVIAWVPFRAENFTAVARMYAAMVGLNGISLPYRMGDLALAAPLAEPGIVTEGLGYADPWLTILGIPAALAFVWLLPNTYELMATARPGLPSRGYPATVVGDGAAAIGFTARLASAWRPSAAWGAATACLFFASVLGLTRVTEFLYFQF